MSTATDTKPRLFEKGPGFKAGLKDLPKHLNQRTITAGLISTVFGCTGPALLTIQSATTAGYQPNEIITWLFGIYFFGGLLGAILSLYYKQPISGAWSIPGAAMLATSLAGVPFNEAAGAFIIAGVIVLIIGLTGLIGKIMRWLPLPLVMAMIAGAMIRFGTATITAIISRNAEGVFNYNALIVGGVALLGYLIMPLISKKISPVLAALVLGVAAALLTGTANFSGESFASAGPQFIAPVFRVGTILAVSIPLAALVMGAENAQAMGVLMAQGYKPPMNMMTITSGIGGMVSGIFGGHNANIAGPMTAICSSEEAGDDKEGRYVAAVVNGITFGAFGLLAGVAFGFVKGLPSGLISVLAGVAMINVLYNAFSGAFTGKFKIGAFFSLCVAMSGITLFKIGAPFWALVFGVLVSLLGDMKDFKENKAK